MRRVTEMKINFYATYRQVVGGKTVDVPISDGITVRQLIDAIITRYPQLRTEMFDENGELYRSVHVFVNGRDAPLLANGLETVLQPDDSVNIFPPVAGGSV
jgi:molybdopterin synthase sulfur carrier subunit